jgi:hypothetical protein
MLVLRVRGVNEAYAAGLQYLQTTGVPAKSRAGDVLVFPSPVCIEYTVPQERVLLDPKRDANPFFHLGEALWMLAGRDDARWLDRFVSDFSTRFAEEDGHQHGAYGYRWRRHFHYDQLEVVVARMKHDPTDRRIVIAMWDGVADRDTSYRDNPCNLTALPRIIDGRLDLTVFNRSNDAIWGAFGANVVHFSILQEYLAAQLRLPIGSYYQISNNFHVYANELQKRWPPEPFDGNYPEPIQPLVDDPPTFDSELRKLLKLIEVGCPDLGVHWQNRFLVQTAMPFFRAHAQYKAGDYRSAMESATTVVGADWRAAAMLWLGRRIAKKAPALVAEYGELED